MQGDSLEQQFVLPACRYNGKIIYYEEFTLEICDCFAVPVIVRDCYSNSRAEQFPPGFANRKSSGNHL